MRRFQWLAVIPLALLGCSDGLERFPTTPASGRVLCEGKPVANVRVDFAPKSKPGEAKKKGLVGKMGEGITDADGNFTISTYADGDGAVVGWHSISVSPPHPEDFPDFRCDCRTGGGKAPIRDVEVTKDGENEFTIELPPKAKHVEEEPPTQRKLDELEDAKRSAEEEPAG